MYRHLLIGCLAVVTMATASVLGNKADDLCGDATGYNCLFQSSKTQVSDKQVYFDNALPSWLTGTLIRNGAGLFHRKHQSVSHVFDGLAKLSSWKFFPNGTAVFSTRFVKSDFYEDTIKSDKFPPYLLFAPPKPEFKRRQKPLCFINGIDNLNVNIYDFPGKRGGGRTYGVLGDYWATYQVSPSDLSTVNYFKPKLGKFRNFAYLDMLSSAHPLPEPGTDNRLTFLVRERMTRFQKNRLVLVRMSSISGRSVIAQWKSKSKFPYMHSFSVTQTKAVMLAAPFYSDGKCLLKKAAPLPCMDWFENKPSTLYVVDLKTGKKSTLKIPALFVLHHINAYDLSAQEMIMDVSSYDSPAIVNQMLMIDVITNPKKRNGIYTPARNKRIRINFKTDDVTIEDYSTDSPVTDGLDMPAINENYRSKRYCFVYGPVNFADGENFTRLAVIKKDMCNGGMVVGRLSIASHYPVEPVFVPNPAGTSEDDGVLLVPMLRGTHAVTYLAVVDAKTMTIVSQADMPGFVPFSFHGRFFKDVY